MLSIINYILYITCCIFHIQYIILYYIILYLHIYISKLVYIKFIIIVTISIYDGLY